LLVTSAASGAALELLLSLFDHRTLAHTVIHGAGVSSLMVVFVALADTYARFRRKHS
jgi:hypothetical protein